MATVFFAAARLGRALQRRGISSEKFVVDGFGPIPLGLGFRVYWPLVSWEGRIGEEHGNDYNGLYRNCYKDPFLHS